jgi:hypothetical protein
MNPLKNFIEAVKKHNANGREVVSPRVQMLRQDICVKCEAYNPPTKQCKICFCVIPIKVRMESEKCPKGKW